MKTTKIELANNCLLLAKNRWGGYEFSVLHTPTGVESDDFIMDGTLYEAFRLAEKVASGEATFWGGLPYQK